MKKLSCNIVDVRLTSATTVYALQLTKYVYNENRQSVMFQFSSRELVSYDVVIVFDCIIVRDWLIGHDLESHGLESQ